MDRVQPLGRLLVASGLLSQQALDEVLLSRRADGRRLGELLAEKGLIRTHELAQFLSHQLACPWVSLHRMEISPEAVEVLPRAIAIEHHMVPVHLRMSRGATTLYVAMDDPTDERALMAAARAAAMPVKAMVALPDEIRMHLERLYGASRAESSPTLRPHEPPETKRIPIPSKNEGSFHALPSRPPKPPPPKLSAPPPPKVSAPPPPKASVAPPKTNALHFPKTEVPPPNAETKKTPTAVFEEATIVDLIEEIELDPVSHPPSTAKVLVIDAEQGFVDRIRTLATRCGADVHGVGKAESAGVATALAPCAIIVSETVYGHDRVALDRLALDVGALLIVSSDTFELGPLEDALKGAIERWRWTPYEKGAVVDGRYELVRDLGGRFVGSRWEAKHLRTGRRSLLKVGVRIANDPSDAEAIRRELHTLSRFEHHGAIALLDAGSTELDDPYVVLEMLEGKSLEGLVAARGPLPTAEACSVIRQIADVLAAAHEAGVRHGDVRPENVLIIRDTWGIQRVKLVNWEATSVSSSSMDSTDATIDLAGLGACAFFALSGRARNEGENVRSIRSGKWAPLDIPPALAVVVSRTLGGAGTDRFGSTKEFVEALDAVAPPQPILLHLLDSAPEQRGTSLRPRMLSTLDESEVPLVPHDVPLDTGGELRRHPRVPYRTPVSVQVPGVGAIEGRSEDISERGLFVVTRAQIAEGTDITLRFALPNDGTIVSERGVVRWVRLPQAGDGSGSARAIGIELCSPSSDSSQQIARYISLTAREW